MKRAVLLAAVAAVAIAAPALADVRAGIEAWQRGDYAGAVKEWEPDAQRGDADAQFNLGQAYKLGKGVPVDMAKAQSWYKKAADQGHDQALANYGLMMFQSGNRAEALPMLTKAADRGEPRAQYVVGTALFNGDFGNKDWPRAYAYMSAAATGGLPQAAASLAQMDKYVSEPDRKKGLQIARGLGKPTPVVDSLATAQAMHTSGPVRPGIEASPLPPSQPAVAEQTPPPATKPHAASRSTAKPASAPKPVATPLREVATASASRAPAAKPAEPKHIVVAAAPAPAAGGKWRIQLGAYGSPAAASTAWAKVSGKLPGFGRLTSSAGSMTRLQTGPFASKAAAAKACGLAKSSGLACLAVPAP